MHTPQNLSLGGKRAFKGSWCGWRFDTQIALFLDCFPCEEFLLRVLLQVALDSCCQIMIHRVLVQEAPHLPEIFGCLAHGHAPPAPPCGVDGEKWKGNDSDDGCDSVVCTILLLSPCMAVEVKINNNLTFGFSLRRSMCMMRMVGISLHRMPGSGHAKQSDATMEQKYGMWFHVNISDQDIYIYINTYMMCSVQMLVLKTQYVCLTSVISQYVISLYAVSSHFMKFQQLRLFRHSSELTQACCDATNHVSKAHLGSTFWQSDLVSHLPTHWNFSCIFSCDADQPPVQKPQLLW